MNHEITTAFQLASSHLHRLVEGLSEEQMVTQPCGIRNHPKWILGHLCFSYQAMGEELAIPAWLPDGWSALFRTGSMPSANDKDYPSSPALLQALTESEATLVRTITAIGPNRLRDPLPDKAYRKALPTIGHALVHILVGHSSLHIGQLTSWRAAMGLPHIAEAFDR